jgi:hypothetical protein
MLKNVPFEGILEAFWIFLYGMSPGLPPKSDSKYENFKKIEKYEQKV